MYGFKGLTKDFITDHPGYYINPKRLNGSAVETLFGQLKHTTGGHLSAANYATAKATLLTKSQTKGKDGYRSTPLYLRQSEQGNQNQVIMCTLTKHVHVQQNVFLD